MLGIKLSPPKAAPILAPLINCWPRSFGAISPSWGAMRASAVPNVAAPLTIGFTAACLIVAAGLKARPIHGIFEAIFPPICTGPPGPMNPA